MSSATVDDSIACTAGTKSGFIAAMTSAVVMIGGTVRVTFGSTAVWTELLSSVFTTGVLSMCSVSRRACCSGLLFLTALTSTFACSGDPLWLSVFTSAPVGCAKRDSGTGGAERAAAASTAFAVVSVGEVRVGAVAAAAPAGVGGVDATGAAALVVAGLCDAGVFAADVSVCPPLLDGVVLLVLLRSFSAAVSEGDVAAGAATAAVMGVAVFAAAAACSCLGFGKGKGAAVEGDFGDPLPLPPLLSDAAVAPGAAAAEGAVGETAALPLPFSCSVFSGFLFSAAGFAAVATAVVPLSFFSSALSPPALPFAAGAATAGADVAFDAFDSAGAVFTSACEARVEALLSFFSVLAGASVVSAETGLSTVTAAAAAATLFLNSSVCDRGTGSAGALAEISAGDDVAAAAVGGVVAAAAAAAAAVAFAAASFASASACRFTRRRSRCSFFRSRSRCRRVLRRFGVGGAVEPDAGSSTVTEL